MTLLSTFSTAFLARVGVCTWRRGGLLGRVVREAGRGPGMVPGIRDPSGHACKEKPKEIEIHFQGPWNSYALPEMWEPSPRSVGAPRALPKQDLFSPSTFQNQCPSGHAWPGRLLPREIPSVPSSAEPGHAGSTSLPSDYHSEPALEPRCLLRRVWDPGPGPLPGRKCKGLRGWVWLAGDAPGVLRAAGCLLP